MTGLALLDDFTPLSTLLRIVLAVLFGGAIGFERGRHGRAAGLRTHVLVCVGSALSSLTGMYLIQEFGMGDPSRIAAGVVSGIGFLGAGMIIIKNHSKVTGLTTAAALWATATVGLAVGAGFTVGALIGTAVIFISTTLLTVLETNQKKDARFYLELDDIRAVNRVMRAVREAFPYAHSFDVLPPKSGIAGHIGICMNINTAVNGSEEIIARLGEIENVLLSVEE